MWRGHAGQHQSNLLQQCQQVNMDHKYFKPNSGGADCARTFFSFLFLSEKRGLEVLNFWTFPYSLQLLIWFWVSPNHPPHLKQHPDYESMKDFRTFTYGIQLITIFLGMRDSSVVFEQWQQATSLDGQTSTL